MVDRVDLSIEINEALYESNENFSTDVLELAQHTSYDQNNPNDERNVFQVTPEEFPEETPQGSSNNTRVNTDSNIYKVMFNNPFYFGLHFPEKTGKQETGVVRKDPNISLNNEKNLSSEINETYEFTIVDKKEEIKIDNKNNTTDDLSVVKVNISNAVYCKTTKCIRFKVNFFNKSSKIFKRRSMAILTLSEEKGESTHLLEELNINEFGLFSYEVTINEDLNFREGKFSFRVYIKSQNHNDQITMKFSLQK